MERASLQSYLSSAAAIVRLEGFFPFVGRGLKKVASPLVGFGSVVFFVRDLDRDDPGAERRAAHLPGIDLRQVRPEEVFGLLRRPGADATAVRRAAEESLRRGARFCVAFDEDGRPMHTRWVARAGIHIPEIGMEFVPRADEAYFYDGYTHPACRARGLDGLMRRFIFATARAEGARRAWSYVRGDNPVGLKAAAKWQRRFATVRYVRLRGRAAPVLFGLRRLADRLRSPAGGLRIPAVGPGGNHATTAAAEREGAWRRWFEDFTRRPLEKRSTGYDALPPEYFDSASDFIISTLRLDPGKDEVLDLGCDSAMLTRHVAPRCRRLVGADFIPGQVADSRRQGAICASGEPAAFLVADARSLPFTARSFDKAYCTGVIHTLASHADALRVIQELVRICRAGGEVLLGALPDRSKRGAALRRAWRNGALAQRARIAGVLLVPQTVRDLVRRLLPFLRRREIVALEFDLPALKAMLERAGLGCRISDFPSDYWNNDFRTTRSNLLISMPGTRTDRGGRSG